MEAVILIGIQASGKSTFWLERFRDTHVRINLDMLRTRNREERLLGVCLETQQPFVVDNTNPTPEDRARYLGPAIKAGYRVVGFYFQSRVKECLARNAQRPDAKRVPDAGVLGCAGRLVLPTLAEGFNQLWYVSLEPGGGFKVEEWTNEVQ